jgi:hypothetical protein
MSSIDEQIEKISQGILETIEQKDFREVTAGSEIVGILHLTDVRSAKKLVDSMDKASTKSERNVGKIDVIKAMLLSTWLQRLYFIIRSLMMSILSALLYLSVILVIGSINLVSGIALGIISFVFSLVISRLFDTQIVSLTKYIIVFLGKHQQIRNLIINYL